MSAETETGLDFDVLDTKADEWMAECGVRQMVDTITGVFAKWASPELLTRFREQVESIMRQSFAEGAVRAWSDVRPLRRAALSDDEVSAAIEETGR